MNGRRPLFLVLLGFSAGLYLTTTVFLPEANQLADDVIQLFVGKEEYLEILMKGCSDVTLHLEGLKIPDISQYPTSLTVIEEHFSDVVNGSWSPAPCLPEQKLALVVPYRDRAEQLPIFLYHMNRFLQKQMLHYQIFVVEQSDSESFNRAALFNVGYQEARKIDDFNCFVFHDVDILPENDELAYVCRKGVARHFAELTSRKKYKRQYKQCAGGVMAFDSEDFAKINGFSNSYWGWGAEDDDLYRRIRQGKLIFEHQTDEQGRYTTLPHAKEKKNRERKNILGSWKLRSKQDGLNSLVYEVVDTEATKLFTKISVDLQELRKSVKEQWDI